MDFKDIRKTFESSGSRPSYGLPKPRSGTTDGPRGSVKALVDMYEKKVRNSVEPPENEIRRNTSVGKLGEDKLRPYSKDFSPEPGQKPSKSTVGFKDANEYLDFIDGKPEEKELIIPYGTLKNNKFSEDSGEKSTYYKESARNNKVLAQKINIHDLKNEEKNVDFTINDISAAEENSKSQSKDHSKFLYENTKNVSNSQKKLAEKINLSKLDLIPSKNEVPESNKTVPNNSEVIENLILSAKASQKVTQIENIEKFDKSKEELTIKNEDIQGPEINQSPFQNRFSKEFESSTSQNYEILYGEASEDNSLYTKPKEVPKSISQKRELNSADLAPIIEEPKNIAEVPNALSSSIFSKSPTSDYPYKVPENNTSKSSQMTSNLSLEIPEPVKENHENLISLESNPSASTHSKAKSPTLVQKLSEENQSSSSISPKHNEKLQIATSLNVPSQNPMPKTPISNIKKLQLDPLKHEKNSVNEDLINEIDILCVNCYECISAEDVDSHSLKCVKPLITAPEMSEADIRIRKLLKSIASHKIKTTRNKYNLYCKLEEYSIAILEKSMNSYTLQEKIEETLNEALTYYDGLPIVVLSKRLSNLLDLKGTFVVEVEGGDVLKMYEEEAERQKKELERWKLRSELLLQLAGNPSSQGIYVDSEIGSSRSSVMSFGTCFSDVGNDIAVLEDVDSVLREISEEELERHFYRLCIKAKMALPKGTANKFEYSQMYAQVNKLKVPVSQWKDFIERNLI